MNCPPDKCESCEQKKSCDEANDRIRTLAEEIFDLAAGGEHDTPFDASESLMALALASGVLIASTEPDAMKAMDATRMFAKKLSQAVVEGRENGAERILMDVPGGRLQ